VVTTPTRTDEAYRGAIKSIGLWGAPQSGKTTYLASLYVAISRASMELNIFGIDDASTDFLVSASSSLSRGHGFPAATETVGSYRWIMSMATHVQVPRRSRFGRADTPDVPLHVQFNIDMRDVPGAVFGYQSAAKEPEESPYRLDLGGQSTHALAGPGLLPGTEDMMDYLAGCDGLLFLVDPVREREFGDSHEYFQNTLLRVAQRKVASMPPGSRLPHHVAVCITKFDHPQVYKFARLNGYRTYDENDPYLFPRVHDDDAEAFFKDLCDNSGMGDADLISNSLSRYFHPQRVRYFVTSSVGFYRHGGRFREEDFQNTVEQEDGSVRIRGQIHPINVLEPMLWLGQSVTTER